jgi:uncharacterized protein (DUF58 family)
LAIAPARSRAPAQPALRQRAEQLAASLPPLMAAAERVAATVAQGVHGRRRVGPGESFWQFRRYQPGDAAGRVDWRQSAKSQKYFVRENEWEAAQSVWLWRDGSASMRYRSAAAETEKLERATLLLLALAALLIRGGERVALLGAQERPASGRAALTRLAERLLGDGEAETASLPAPERLPRHARLVLIGDFLSPLPELDRLVRDYAGQGLRGHLLQTLDPAEEDLPFRGRTRFEGVEGEGQLTVGRAETLREAYVNRLAARREALAGLARSVGWTAAFHRTDRAPQTALLALYGALESDG